MKKIVSYQINKSWKECSKVIDAINNNCIIEKEPPIPIKIYIDIFGIWCIKCLNEADNTRIEKHLKYILGSEE